MAFESCTHDPWVGALYKSGIRSRRTLLLGESHYAGADTIACGSRPGTKSFTADAIRAWALKSKRHRFFTKVPRLFRFDPSIEAARHEFWNRVAFYNYVQQALIGARVPPTEMMWREAGDPLREVLDELRPERVVVFGRRLWMRVPSDEEIALDREGEDPLDVKVLNVAAHRTLLTRTDHPSSSRFRYDKWQSKIDHFLSIA